MISKVEIQKCAFQTITALLQFTWIIKEMFGLVDDLHASYEDLWKKEPCKVLSFWNRKWRKPYDNYFYNTCIQIGNVNLQTALYFVGITHFCITFIHKYRRKLDCNNPSCITFAKSKSSSNFEQALWEQYPVGG